MRILTNISKVDELQKIFSDLSQDFQGKSLSVHLSEKQSLREQDEQGKIVDIYVQQLIPIGTEKKIEFLLNQVPRQSYTLYLKWFLDQINLAFG